MLVILIMVGYYRFAGVLAVAALGSTSCSRWAGSRCSGATLTLPGLAGFVLSIGIAVDANVLIFERIREELAHGKTVRLAVDEGFKHAMNAIVDSNVSDGPHGALPVPVRHRPGQGLRGDAHHGHRWPR